jgi:hypothetical protein
MPWNETADPTFFRVASKFQLNSAHAASAAEFLIRCPEGEAASEYQLLKLHEKGDRREFRTVTGGALHASGGSDRDAMNFDFDKVAPRTYRVKLVELKKGEYGFLGGGKLFTFSVE